MLMPTMETQLCLNKGFADVLGMREMHLTCCIQSILKRNIGSKHVCLEGKPHREPFMCSSSHMLVSF